MNVLLEGDDATFRSRSVIICAPRTIVWDCVGDDDLRQAITESLVRGHAYACRRPGLAIGR
jgi:hypothetical protein